MGQVFLSYASADRERVKRLALAMQDRGYSVWWDRQIAPGQTFDEVIENALNESSCVVVLWSATSVKSQWVKTEASEAAGRRILVPARIDDVKIPLEFRRLQAADLTKWDGNPADPEFEKFLRAVDSEIQENSAAVWNEAPTAIGRAAPGAAAPPAPRPQPRAPQTPPAVERATVAPSTEDIREPFSTPPEPRRTGLWIAAALSIVAIIGAAFFWFNRETRLQTPNVVGMPYENGAASLTAAALAPERREQVSPGETPGSIVAQDPAPGSMLPQGAKVTLTIAVAPPAPPEPARQDVVTASTDAPPVAPAAPVEPPATIPDLRGQPRDRAGDLLAAAALSLGDTTEIATNDAGIGTIVGQEPEALKSTAKGSRVNITVAARRKAPELVGMKFEEAQEALTKLGLRHRVERVRAAARNADNRVASQAPAPNAEMNANDEATLTVSIVTPKTVNGGESLFRTNGRRCVQVCKDLGLKWTTQWSGANSTCTCDF